MVGGWGEDGGCLRMVVGGVWTWEWFQGGHVVEGGWVVALEGLVVG